MKNQGGKRAVPRHRTQARASAARQERTIEKGVRQAARKDTWLEAVEDGRFTKALHVGGPGGFKRPIEKMEEEIVFAADCYPCECCDEPWCDKHNMHYADCPCKGPHSEED